MAVPVCTPTGIAGIQILPFFSIIWRCFTIWANLVDVGSLGYFNVYFFDYLDTLLSHSGVSFCVMPVLMLCTSFTVFSDFFF